MNSSVLLLINVLIRNYFAMELWTAKMEVMSHLKSVVSVNTLNIITSCRKGYHTPDLARVFGGYGECCKLTSPSCCQVLYSIVIDI